MDVLVKSTEPGERDLSPDEIGRRRVALLGRRGSTYVRRHSSPCVVAVLADDAWDLSPPEREEVLLGTGASFAEAFAKAEREVAKRWVFHQTRDGVVGWFDLATLDLALLPVPAEAGR